METSKEQKEVVNQQSIKQQNDMNFKRTQQIYRALHTNSTMQLSKAVKIRKIHILSLLFWSFILPESWQINEVHSTERGRGAIMGVHGTWGYNGVPDTDDNIGAQLLSREILLQKTIQPQQAVSSTYNSQSQPIMFIILKGLFLFSKGSRKLLTQRNYLLNIVPDGGCPPSK